MEPITREEMYLAAAAGYDITPPEPITRKEFFLAKLAGMDVQLPATFSREEMFLDAVAQRSPAAVIEALNVTENGVYTAGNGVDGYSPVTVDIPDPVLQDKTITENGTYTADSGFDGLGEILVNVMQNAPSNELKVKKTGLNITNAQKGMRINLDIGFDPDIIIFYTGDITYPTTGVLGLLYIGVSPRVNGKYGLATINVVVACGPADTYHSGYSIDIASAQNSSYPITAADATGFNIGTKPDNGYYNCYAFGGLA